MARSTFMALLAVLAFFNVATFAVPNVEQQGAVWVTTTNNQRLDIVGVDYQPGGQGAYNPEAKRDPLSDATVCLRDAALMQILGVKVIRVYNVDWSLNHDACMSIFNVVGIYVIIDVNAPFAGESLSRSDPEGSLTTQYANRTMLVLEAFMYFPNTLAFFAGNEVINDVDTAKNTPPYIRVVVKWLREYLARHSKRQIAVGYSAADVREVLEDTYNYFTCAIDGKDDDMSRSTMFGLNSYSWCGGKATIQTSGYDVLARMFAQTPVPVFFSEYGCNEVTPRTFDEVPALYGPQMTALSGGLIYEYSQEPSNYGLVNINDNGTISLLNDFNNLRDKFARIDNNIITAIPQGATTRRPQRCDPGLIKESGFNKNFDLPDYPRGVQQLIDQGAPTTNKGRIVDVTDITVQPAVYNTDGSQLANLQIRPLPADQINAPGADAYNGNPPPKKQGAATKVSGASAALIAAAVLALFLV